MLRTVKWPAFNVLINIHTSTKPLAKNTFHNNVIVRRR